MAERRVVPAASGVGLRLQNNERLRIIDPEGGQSGDLLAYSQDGRERLSNGRTFDYGGKIYVSTGDVLWSDLSKPMLTIVSDEVGRHDFLYASCTLEMYRIEYKVAGYHPNCADNLSAALRELGIEPGPLPTATRQSNGTQHAERAGVSSQSDRAQSLSVKPENVSVNSRDASGPSRFPVTATSRKTYVLTSLDIYENLIDALGTTRCDLIKLANLAAPFACGTPT